MMNLDVSDLKEGHRKTQKDIKILSNKVDGLTEKTGELTDKTETLTKKTGELSDKTETLFQKTDKLVDNAEILSKKVETTYQLALAAWVIGTENRKWLQQVF